MSKSQSRQDFTHFFCHLESDAPVFLQQELCSSTFRVLSILEDMKKYGTNIELKFIEADCEEK